jgi:hypothetical protein
MTPNWGDVPSWFEAVGTVGALTAVSVAWRQDRRRSHLENVSAQARAFHMWIAPDDDGRPAWRYVNPVGGVIRRVVVTVSADDDPIYDPGAAAVTKGEPRVLLRTAAPEEAVAADRPAPAADPAPTEILEPVKPTPEEPAVEQPVDKPAVEGPAVDGPPVEKQAAEKQAVEKQAAEKQAAEKQGVEKQPARAYAPDQAFFQLLEPAGQATSRSPDLAPEIEDWTIAYIDFDDAAGRRWRRDGDGLGVITSTGTVRWEGHLS